MNDHDMDHESEQSDENKSSDLPQQEEETTQVTKIDVEEAPGFEVIGQPTSALILKQKRLRLSEGDAVVANKRLLVSSTHSDGYFDASRMPSVPIRDEFSKFFTTSLNCSTLFPVQKYVIPFLEKQLATRGPHRDVLVSSPTGSGKTLTYVLPIVQFIVDKDLFAGDGIEGSSDIRFIVMVPVTELVAQVKKTFEKAFVDISEGREGMKRFPWNLVHVSTPGKFIDFIHSMEIDFKKRLATNKRFNVLQHLRLLILDEADRLQSNDVEFNWMKEIVDHVTPQHVPVVIPIVSPSKRTTRQRKNSESESFFFDSITNCITCPDLRPEILTPCQLMQSIISPTVSNTRIHKWLFSATLTVDPVKLHSFRLFHPMILDFEDKVKGLTEYVVPFGADSLKPLVLWWYLHHVIPDPEMKMFLVFTSGVESSHRLKRLLQLMTGPKELTFVEMSSLLKNKERKKVLDSLTCGHVIIASDMMARGMDLENVTHVINYDLPSNETGYTHRVGRTARGGSEGTAVSFVPTKRSQIRNSIGSDLRKKLMSLPLDPSMDKHTNHNEMIHSYIDLYETALLQLKKAVKQDKTIKQNKSILKGVITA